MRGKVFINEIHRNRIENYVNTKVYRLNGLVEITRVTKNGVFYLKEKMELMSASPKGFYIPGVFLPWNAEDDQFAELHSYSYASAVLYLPKQENGLLISGIHPSAPLIEVYQDKLGFFHVNRASQKKANTVEYRHRERVQIKQSTDYEIVL